MKTDSKDMKKWQKLILRWHDPELQEAIGFLVGDISFLKKNMSLHHKMVASSIIKFVEKMYSKGYSSNMYEDLHNELVREIAEYHSYDEHLDYNLRCASFINEIKGKLPEEFYWKDDDRKLTIDRAEKLIGFLEKVKNPNSEEYKVLRTSTKRDSIDEEIQKKTGERDWEDEYIKEFPYRFKKC